MKKFVFVLAVLVASTASAQLQPEEIFGGILDIIQDQINNNKKPGYGSGVILKDLGNNRIALGSIRLNADGQGQSSFVLPKCNQSDNKQVGALRFRIDNADAYVDRIRIVYHNGENELVDVDRVYDQNSLSGWYEIPGGKRCVKSITVRGKSVEIIDGPYGFVEGFSNFDFAEYPPGAPGHSGPPNGHPGWGGGVEQPPYWGGQPPPANEPPPYWGGQPPPPPGHKPPGHKPPGWSKPVPPPYYEPAPTVLTFIGLKAATSGF